MLLPFSTAYVITSYTAVLFYYIHETLRNRWEWALEVLLEDSLLTGKCAYYVIVTSNRATELH